MMWSRRRPTASRPCLYSLHVLTPRRSGMPALCSCPLPLPDSCRPVHMPPAVFQDATTLSGDCKLIPSRLARNWTEVVGRLRHRALGNSCEVRGKARPCWIPECQADFAATPHSRLGQAATYRRTSARPGPGPAAPRGGRRPAPAGFSVPRRPRLRADRRQPASRSPRTGSPYCRYAAWSAGRMGDIPQAPVPCAICPKHHGAARHAREPSNPAPILALHSMGDYNLHGGTTTASSWAGEKKR